MKSHLSINKLRLKKNCNLLIIKFSNISLILNPYFKPIDIKSFKV